MPTMDAADLLSLLSDVGLANIISGYTARPPTRAEVMTRLLQFDVSTR